MRTSHNSPAEQIEIYFSKLHSAFQQVMQKEIENIFNELIRVRTEGSKLFIAGNGGSAATSQHFAVDLGVGGLSRNSVIRAVCLSDNQSALTAVANDDNFINAYSSQIMVWGESHDVLMVISASGNSQNLINATEMAKSLGMTTLGLLGFDGGKLRELCDHSVLVKTSIGEYGIVEDVHLAICHNLCEALRSINL